MLAKFKQATGWGLLLEKGKDMDERAGSSRTPSAQQQKRGTLSPSPASYRAQNSNAFSAAGNSSRPSSSPSRMRLQSDVEDRSLGGLSLSTSPSRRRPISPLKIMMTVEMIEEKRRVVELLHHVRQERHEREKEERLAKVHEEMQRKRLQDKEARKAQALAGRLKFEEEVRKQGIVVA